MSQIGFIFFYLKSFVSFTHHSVKLIETILLGEEKGPPTTSAFATPPTTSEANEASLRRQPNDLNVLIMSSIAKERRQKLISSKGSEQMRKAVASLQERLRS